MKIISIEFHLEFVKFLVSRLLRFCLRESVSKLVCDWEGLGGRGGEEVHDDSIKNKEEKLRTNDKAPEGGGAKV